MSRRRTSWNSWAVLFQRHPRIARLFPTGLRSRLVWLELTSDPEFVEGMRRGNDDLTAGRWWRVDRKAGLLVPNPDWPDDGTRPDGPKPWPPG